MKDYTNNTNEENKNKKHEKQLIKSNTQTIKKQQQK